MNLKQLKHLRVLVIIFALATIVSLIAACSIMWYRLIQLENIVEEWTIEIEVAEERGYLDLDVLSQIYAEKSYPPELDEVVTAALMSLLLESNTILSDVVVKEYNNFSQRLLVLHCSCVVISVVALAANIILKRKIRKLENANSISELSEVSEEELL